jgi:hypothetical protein
LAYPEGIVIPEISFGFENGKVIVKGLPPELHLRRIEYTSAALAELRRISIASINIQAAKFYMDSTRTINRETDPHLFDAALLSAIVKYGSAFKSDNSGKGIDPAVIFSTKVTIASAGDNRETIVIDDPGREFLKHHQTFIRLRDKFIAHDDRIIGATECFALLDNEFTCEHVLVLTERAPVFAAIKDIYIKLPMCIDAAFTWLAAEKNRYCQVVNDEINNLKLKVRQKFSEPTFERFKGLSDATERNAKSSYWTFDWDSGEKKLVPID